MMFSNKPTPSFLKLDHPSFHRFPIAILKTYLLILGCLSIIACSGGTDNTAKIPTDFDAEVLYSNAEHLEQLIEKEEVASLVGVPVSELHVIYEDYSDAAAGHMLLFSWENKETNRVQMSQDKVELLGFSSIGFGRITQMTLAEFEQAYQPKTAESVKAEIKTVTSDASIDSDVAIWEAKEIAKNAKTQTFEKLENVGESAYWETPRNVLHVWAGEQAFSVSANLTDDSEENKDKAIALATLIFQHAKSRSK